MLRRLETGFRDRLDTGTPPYCGVYLLISAFEIPGIGPRFYDLGWVLDSNIGDRRSKTGALPTVGSISGELFDRNHLRSRPGVDHSSLLRRFR